MLRAFNVSNNFQIVLNVKLHYIYLIILAFKIVLMDIFKMNQFINVNVNSFKYINY
jgi:hypothetical protein